MNASQTVARLLMWMTSHSNTKSDSFAYQTFRIENKLLANCNFSQSSTGNTQNRNNISSYSKMVRLKRCSNVIKLLLECNTSRSITGQTDCRFGANAESVGGRMNICLFFSPFFRDFLFFLSFWLKIQFCKVPPMRCKPVSARLTQSSLADIGKQQSNSNSNKNQFASFIILIRIHFYRIINVRMLCLHTVLHKWETCWADCNGFVDGPIELATALLATSVR